MDGENTHPHTSNGVSRSNAPYATAAATRPGATNPAATTPAAARHRPRNSHRVGATSSSNARCDSHASATEAATAAHGGRSRLATHTHTTTAAASSA